MKKLLVLVLMFLMLDTYAQQSVPVFTSKKDSVQYHEVQAALQEIFRNNRGATSSVQVDSLMRIQMELRTRITGYRTIFTPNTFFTPLSDIESGKIRPEQVTRLSVANSNAHRVPRSIYQCTRLEAIEFVNTSVRKIPRKLNKLAGLSTIYLFNNQSRSHLRLTRNKQVKELVIRGVESGRLPRNYRNLTALQELDLSRNIGLKEFPNVYGNTRLRKLSLAENIITLSDLKDGSGIPLEELNLQRNRIERVPGILGSFSSLKKLSFNYNQIAEVGQGFERLSNLEELSFYNNRLAAVPDGVYSLEKLTAIDLYYNEIELLDARISNLRNLEILFLSNNRLRSLPESIGELSNLKELYIHNNRLSYLPASLTNLSNLRVLRLNNNYFTSFPEPILGLRELENLDVSNNNLNRFPAELIEFYNLQILSIVDNPWENKDDILKIAELLRIRGTVVHLGQSQIRIENN